MPTVDEARAFLANDDTNKRAQLIERLLDSEDYADYFANKWSAVLRNKRRRPHAERIRELYLVALSREPSAEELSVLKAHISRSPKNLKAAYEDIIWSLVNTEEFLFNH